MIAPGAFAIFIPLAVGLGAGPRCLIGTLAGGIATGCMMAILMSNAGGAWDNSKKLCEKLQIKKSDQGKACVVGDTVGDPFKDTSGPALNILIKLMSMVSLTIAPLLQGNETYDDWPFGLIPVGVAVIITIVHYNKYGSILADVKLDETKGSAPAPKSIEPEPEPEPEPTPEEALPSA